MGWGIFGSADVLFTGCVNSTVNELYKHVNIIFGQFALSFTNDPNSFSTASAGQRLAG
jgi:hypothetical protein